MLMAMRYAAFTVLLLVASASAQPPGERLMDQVADAYADASTYQATVDFSIHQKNGPWTNRKSAQMFTAYDRETGRIKIDDPDIYVIVDGPKLLARTDQFPGRHLDAAAPDPLTWEQLADDLPILQPRPAFDMVFLLAADPVRFLADDLTARATPLGPDPADPLGRPRLRIPRPGMLITLTINPDTKLIDAAVVDINAAGADAMAMVYRYNAKVNEPLPDDAFAFDTANSTPMPTFRELVNPPAGMAGGGAAPSHPLQNRLAPNLELTALDGQQVKLNELEHDVIVLSFFTTWARPCVTSVEQMDELQAWADETGRDVALYLINLYEPRSKVEAFLKARESTLTTLLDVEGVAASEYQALVVPHTVVIHDGKIVATLSGPNDELADALKKVIEPLTPPEASPEAPPDKEAAP